MVAVNPYASPAPDGSPSSEAKAESTHDLVRLLPAVRSVGVAAVLFSLGYLMAFVSGVLTYRNLRGNDDFTENIFVNLPLIGALRQLIVSLAMVYISIVVWRYARAISNAIRTGLVDHSTLMVAQRRCWYAVACLALLLVVLMVAMTTATLMLYRI